MKELKLSEAFQRTLSLRQKTILSNGYTKFINSKVYSDIHAKSPENYLQGFLSFLKATDKPLFKSLNKKIAVAKSRRMDLHECDVKSCIDVISGWGYSIDTNDKSV